MRDVIMQLERLPGVELHQEALRARASLAVSDYQLAACLLVAERSGWARHKGWGSAVQYGVHELELEAQKAADLLRAARLLEGLPLLSEAFRTARVGWGKIRAITRIVTPETEREWLEAALACTTEELARQVALSPREYKRRAQEETASAAERGLDFDAEPSPTAPPPTAGTQQPADFGASGSPEAGPARAAAASRGTTRPTATAPVEAAEPATEAPDGCSPRTSPIASSEPAGASGPAQPGGTSGDSPNPRATPKAARNGARPLPGPRLIRVNLLFTPEQYAIYEKAHQRISSKRRRKVGREEATVEMARHTLDAAPERSRARHQIVVHLDAATELAWLETGRGLHTLTDEQRDALLSEGRIFVTTEASAHGDRNRGTASEQSDRGRNRRTETEHSDRGQDRRTETEQSDRSRGGRTEGEQPDRGQSARPGGKPRDCGEEAPEQGLLDIDGTREKRPAKKLPAQVPLPTLRALFARAGGQCEKCRGSQGLQVHHCTPRSRGGTHDLELLKLLCDRCHGVGHEKDFASDPTWEAARTRARRRPHRTAGG